MADTARFPTARSLARDPVKLPSGVRLEALTTHLDARGDFTELFRDEWRLGERPVQWNMVRSRANVLRGVHLHHTHADYLTMASGEMLLGLRDTRRDSPTAGVSTVLRLQAEDLHLAIIPVGVAHGFYFPAPACHIYAVTHAFDSSDELGCHWADPALGLDWGISEPELSMRDRSAGSFQAMVQAFEAVHA